MSKTSEAFGAGVIDDVGVVSRSGIGDGSYQISTHSDNKGEIVGASILFLDQSLLK